MRIGSLHLTWLPGEKNPIDAQVRTYFGSIQGQQIMSRMARSEVKNYLAEICEQAEISFASPAQFIAVVKEALGHVADEHIVKGEN